MALIDGERDDPEVLAAEDKAIADAQKGEEAVTNIPTGPDLAKLIESLSNAPTTLHEG